MNSDKKRYSAGSKITREIRALTGLRKYRKKKRKPPMNPTVCEKDKTFVSSSSKKLENACELESSINNDIDYVFLNFVTVFSFISQHVECKVCGNNVTFAKSSTRGLGFKIQIICLYCEVQSVPSCPLISNAYEINTRFIFAMQMIGIGYKGAKKFCGIMDLASPVVLSIYDSILQNIMCASQTICDMISRTNQRNNIETTLEQPNEEFSVFEDGFNSNVAGIAENIATCIFNFGSKSYLQVMNVLGIKIGRNADRYFEEEDVEHIGGAEVPELTLDEESQQRESQIAFENAASAAEALLYDLGITE